MRWKQTRRPFCTIIVAFVLWIAASGCGLDLGYLLPAVGGQVHILAQMQRVDDVLASGQLTAEQESKLRLIVDVCDFAGQTMSLNVGDNYSTFYNSHGEPVAFNLSASRKDAFAPRTWTFPLVGTIPYLGYFSKDAALAERDVLATENLDVFIYQVDAYSGLGFYANPILSPMLDRDDVNLVNTVIHELLHATVWRTNDTTFNESLANFFGRTGAVAYYRARYPDDPARAEAAAHNFEDGDRFSTFGLDLFNQLDALFNTDASSAAKIDGRSSIVAAAQQHFISDILPEMHSPDSYSWVADGLPINNAYFLGVRRYNLDLGLFLQVYNALDGDWGESLIVFRAAAGAADPYGFLRDWLDRSADGRLRLIAAQPVPPAAPGHGVCGTCAQYTIAPPPE